MKRKSRPDKSTIVFEELEPRLLLSADPLAVATDAGADSVHEHVLSDNEHEQLLQRNADPVSEQQDKRDRSELVIIDARAPNFQQLHNDVIKAQQQGRSVHVVILDATRDGIEQINEALASHNKLDAVHIVSHGDDAQFQLGATWVDTNTLRERAADISAWKDAFGEQGDLLIYGCSLAETEDGKELVDALGKLTATDVAASDDLTGNSLLGGDWELEYEAGDIETMEELSAVIQESALCGLGQTGPNPVLSTLRYFRDEYEAHIVENRCPAKRCAALLEFRVEPDLCTKCGACFRACPAEAITWKKRLLKRNWIELNK